MRGQPDRNVLELGWIWMLGMKLSYDKFEVLPAEIEAEAGKENKYNHTGSMPADWHCN